MTAVLRHGLASAATAAICGEGTPGGGTADDRRGAYWSRLVEELGNAVERRDLAAAEGEG